MPEPKSASAAAVPAPAAKRDKPVEETGSTIDWNRREFRELPVQLSACIATGTTLLGTLRRLSSGDIVPMQTQVGEPSQLTAEGTAIGAGEIVEVGGRLCLRLTRLGVPRV